MSKGKFRVLLMSPLVMGNVWENGFGMQIFFSPRVLEKL